VSALTASAVALALMGLCASAQTAGPATKQADDVRQALQAMRDSKSSSSTASQMLEMVGVDAFPCDKETADPPAQRACFAARQAYYEYYATALAARQGVYRWNDISTRVIFATVILLVAFGAYLSWVQFFGYTKRTAPPVRAASARAGAAGGSAVKPEAESEIEISLQGIRIKSPVLGVILLTLSLAFFYLYLVFVYPVSERF
jgi:hypothetical protein